MNRALEPELNRLRAGRKDQAAQDDFVASITSWAKGKGAGDADIEIGLEASAVLLGEHGATWQRIAELNLDPERIKQEVIRRGGLARQHTWEEQHKWEEVRDYAVLVFYQRLIAQSHDALNPAVQQVQLERGQQILEVGRESLETSRQGVEATQRLERLMQPPPRDYRGMVRSLAPDLLRDRGSELAELAAFCVGEQDYAPWVAEPWAGKTALMAWFVLNPPDRVDVVSFFVTAGFLEQADSVAFCTNVGDQLRELLHVQPSSLAADRSRLQAEVWDLLRRAAHAAADAERTLVLLVDGLDEDDGRQRGLPSIASLLPSRSWPGLKVITTRRIGSRLPPELAADHPLRTTPPRELAASPHASSIQHLAEQELDRLLRNATQRDVVGLMAASGGGLARDDLLELAELPPFELDALLNSRAGRVIAARPGPVVAGSTPHDTLLFAHDMLRTSATDRLGHRLLQRYRQQIESWADQYQTAGWPPDTPAYVLHHHVLLLAAPESADASVLARIRDVDFLASATREAVARLAWRAQSIPQAHEAVQAVRWALPVMTRRDRSANAAVLQEAWVAVTGRPPPRQRIRPRYRTLVVDASHDDSDAMLPTSMTGGRPAVALATGPGGTVVVVSAGSYAVIWDPRTGNDISVPPTATRPGRLESFGPVARLPTRSHVAVATHGRRAGSVHLLDLQSEGPSLGPALPGPRRYVTALAAGDMSGRPVVVAGTDRGTVVTWFADDLQPVTDTYGLGGHRRPIGALHVVENGPAGPAIIAGDLDGHLGGWDLRTGAPLGDLLVGAHPEATPQQSGGVTAISSTVIAGDTIVATTGGGLTRRWVLTGDGLQAANDMHAPAGATAVEFARWNGRPVMAWGDVDGNLTITDIAAGEPIEVLRGHADAVTTVAFDTANGDETLLTTGADHAVRVWHPAGTRRRPVGHERTSRACAGALGTIGTSVVAVAGREDGSITVWDVHASRVNRHIGSVTDSPITCVALSPTHGSGVVLAGTAAGAVLMHDLSNAETQEVPAAHAGSEQHEAPTWVTSIAVRGDRPQVATGGTDGTIKLWEVEESRLVLVRQWATWHSRPVYGLAWIAGRGQPDLLLSVDADGDLVAWDPETGHDQRHRHALNRAGPPAILTTETDTLLMATTDSRRTPVLWDPIRGTVEPWPGTTQLRGVDLAAFVAAADPPMLLTTDRRRPRVHAWNRRTGEPDRGLRRRSVPRLLDVVDRVLLIQDMHGLTVIELPEGPTDPHAVPPS